MRWEELFKKDRKPSAEDIRAYIGGGAPLWDELTGYIEDEYQTEPLLSFSGCSAQPGWNVKYKKGGKALCTLYPSEGFFIALAVVGPKEEDEVKLCLESGLFSPYVRGLCERTAASPMGRWLMIEVTDKESLEDVQRLLRIRIRPKKRPGCAE